MKFKAELLQNNNMDAAYIEIPFDIEKLYGVKRLKVKAYLNNVEYRGSIVRMKSTSYILGIPKSIRNEMGVVFGDNIDVEIEKDEEERIIEIPIDLANALGEEKLKIFKNLSFSKQKKYVLSVTESKQEKTRLTRIDKVVKDINEKD